MGIATDARYKSEELFLKAAPRVSFSVTFVHFSEKKCFVGPGWKTFVPAGALPTVETVQKVDALRTADRNRAFDLTQCVVADVTNAAAYIVRAILQIRSAASACPEPKACAINIMKLG